MTNKAVREFAKKTYRQVPKLAKQLNVKILMDIHLDPNHKAFMLFEAPNAEAVRDFLARAGFMHFLEIDFHLVTPTKELLAHADEMPTIF
jgi:sugar/nucleoside kinase (ribokinase family)